MSDDQTPAEEIDAVADAALDHMEALNAEIASLTTRLLELSTGRDGRHLIIPPAIVLEIAFDGLQPSKRHESGFALRFPRIARLRDDKSPKDADRLETVRALFEAQVDSGHREHAPQLGLFD